MHNAQIAEKATPPDNKVFGRHPLHLIRYQVSNQLLLPQAVSLVCTRVVVFCSVMCAFMRINLPCIRAV